MAAVKLIWTPGAVRDLEQIHAYVAADSPRYADVVAARIVEAFERLVDFPQSGRVVPELGRGDVRELIHGAYRLVYQLRGDRAEILASITGRAAFRTSGSVNRWSHIAPLANVRWSRQAIYGSGCAAMVIPRLRLNFRR